MIARRAETCLQNLIAVESQKPPPVKPKNPSWSSSADRGAKLLRLSGRSQAITAKEEAKEEVATACLLPSRCTFLPCPSRTLEKIPTKS